MRGCAGDESGVEAALRTELCCLRAAAPRVDVASTGRWSQSHGRHCRSAQRYMLDDDRSK